MYSEGLFSPVVFAIDRREGLKTYTYRGLRSPLPKGSQVDTLVCVADDREFNARFISTEFRMPASNNWLRTRPEEF